MQASRASSRAIRQLAATQIRSLHMTGPAKTSPLLTTERPALNLPRDIAGLRAECQKRKLPAGGTKAELIDRISAHEVANSRSYATRSTATGSSAWNTSVGDSFYVNLQNLHDYDPDTKVAPIRVPVLPHSQVAPASTTVQAEPTVMRAEIFTVSGNNTHIHAPSAMVDVHDNGAIDFQGFAAKVADKLTKPVQTVEEGVSMTRQLWNGFVDDVLGPKASGPSRA